jgi:hypothetical protein
MPVTFVIRLKAEPGSDGIRGLRALLKRALRCHQLRCVRLEMVEADDAPSEDATKAADRGITRNR